MDEISKELGLENLNEADRQKILIQFTESLLKRLILKIHNRLGEADQKEFEKLAGAGDAAKVDEFLRGKIPDLDEVRNEELDNLIKEMKDFLASAKKN